MIAQCHFICYHRHYAPIAQLVEQSPLKRTVVGSNPTGRTRTFLETYAEVAKLADALALGASGVIHGGSSPLLGTNITIARIYGLTRLFFVACTT